MAAKVSRWIQVGLLGLPVYGALTFWASLDPQPDPATRYAEWAQYVTTDTYVIKHVVGSTLGLICALFGTFALGAFLARGRVATLALTAMSICILGLALFLTLMGVSTFAAPMEGQAYLAAIEEFASLPTTFAGSVMGLLFLAVIGLNLVGNLMLGLAVWLSGTLPRWSGALWAAAALIMYLFGIVYAMSLGSQSTPPTVLIGAALVVIAGGWIVYSTRGLHPKPVATPAGAP